MRTPAAVRACVAVAALAAGGCGTAVAPPGSVAANGPVAEAGAARTAGVEGSAPDYPTDSPLLYVANPDASAVDIYQIKSVRHNAGPIATIGSGLSFPFGLARDPENGDLYVSDINVGAVLIFPRGKTTSSGRITKGLLEPLAMSVSPTRELWVSNDIGTVTVYPYGQKEPSKTIAGFGVPFGSAFDASGNFFVADFANVQVYEVKKGTSTPVPLNLQTVGEPIGVTIDGGGNLWVSDGASHNVYVYAPGSTAPSHTIGGFSNPYLLSTDRAGQVFVSDTGANDIVEFAPGKYVPFATLTQGVNEPEGVLARP